MEDLRALTTWLMPILITHAFSLTNKTIEKVTDKTSEKVIETCSGIWDWLKKKCRSDATTTSIMKELEEHPNDAALLSNIEGLLTIKLEQDVETREALIPMIMELKVLIEEIALKRANVQQAINNVSSKGIAAQIAGDKNTININKV